jgi:hypothetical protein
LSLCAISDSNDGRKRHQNNVQYLISKLDTIHPNVINERFPYVLLNLNGGFSFLKKEGWKNF